MGPSMKILSFVCLLYFFIFTSEVLSGNTNGSTSTANDENSTSTESDENEEQDEIGGTSTVYDENQEQEETERYKQCLEDVKKVFNENNSPKQNFLYAFKNLNVDFFNENPTSDEAIYFEELINCIEWDSIGFVIWTTYQFCHEFHMGDRNSVYMENICALNLQDFSYSPRESGNQIITKFYKNEIFDKIHIIHNKNPENRIDKNAIEYIQHYYDYLYEKAKKFKAKQFPSIHSYCNKYNDPNITVSMRNLAIEV